MSNYMKPTTIITPALQRFVGVMSGNQARMAAQLSIKEIVITADTVTPRPELGVTEFSFDEGEAAAMRCVAQSFAALYPAAAGVPGVQRFLNDATTQPAGDTVEELPESIQLALQDALRAEAEGNTTFGFQILLGAFDAVCGYAESAAEFDVEEYLRLTGATHVNPNALSVAEIDAYFAARNRAAQQAMADDMASWDALARAIESGGQTAIGDRARALPPGADRD